MKCTVDSEKLLKALTAVFRAAAAKSNTLPILAGFFLSAKEGKLTVMATDLEICLRASIPAEVLEEGQKVLPKIFLEGIKDMPSGSLELTSEGNALKVLYGLGNEIVINGSDPVQYPSEHFSQSGEGQTTKIPREEFLEIVSSVAYAAATVELGLEKRIFSALALDFREDGLYAIATNTHRLALNRITNEGCGCKGMVLIPANKMAYLARLATGNEVTIKFDGRNASFEMGDCSAWVRLLEGVYPDVSRLIPDRVQAPGRVTVGKTELFAAVNRGLHICASGNVNSLRLQSEEGVLVVSGEGQLGTFREKIAVKETAGKIEPTNLNARYLKEALAAMVGEKVSIYYYGTGSPLLFSPRDGYTALILPIRMREKAAEEKPAA